MKFRTIISSHNESFYTATGLPTSVVVKSRKEELEVTDFTRLLISLTYFWNSGSFAVMC